MAFKPHYDPAIALPLRAVTPEQASAGEAMLWAAYDALRMPDAAAARRRLDLLSHATAEAMTQRGPKAQLHRVRRRGPRADAGRSPSRWHAVREFLLCAMKTEACWTRRRRSAHRPTRRRGRADGGRDRGSRRSSARAPSPSRCSPGARSIPAKMRWAMPTAWPRSCRASARRRRCAPRPTWSTPATSCTSPRRWWPRPFGESYASLVRPHPQAGADPARGARGAGRVAAARRADRTCAQDAAGLLARSARGAAAPGLAPADAALVRGEQDRLPARAGRESLQVFAPLANRLGIWQIKWEIEDLSFRFPRAGPLPRCRHAARREACRTRAGRRELSRRAGLSALATAWVEGRGAGPAQAPLQHLEEDARQGPGLRACVRHPRDARDRCRRAGVLRGARRACTSATRRCPASSTTTSRGPRPTATSRCTPWCMRPEGRPVEIQIRTRAMHEHAEHGVAAHWAYKEAGAKGYAGVSAGSDFDAQVAEARKAVLRQLLAWERDFAEQSVEQGSVPGAAVFDDRIYVFTPQAAVVELPAGATPIDFAYTLHTDLGHRCRGAKVDGQMVPLNTRAEQRPDQWRSRPIKEGGPVARLAQRRTGLPAEFARQAPRCAAWFNALAQRDTIARGREAVEKLLQREGRTAIKLDDLADAARLPQVPTRCSRWSARTSSRCATSRACCGPPSRRRARTRRSLHATSRAPGHTPQGGVLVVGVESLLTSLARCCRPAPPDVIGGYRHARQGRGDPPPADCSNFRQMATRARAGHRRRLGRAARRSGVRSTRWTWSWRRGTARACCATSPRCSPRRR